MFDVDSVFLMLLLALTSVFSLGLNCGINSLLIVSLRSFFWSGKHSTVVSLAL